MVSDAETRQLLQAKHPVRRVEIDEAAGVDAELELLDEATLLQALWKAPRGVQPGVDGWRFEHLWDALRATTSVDPAAARLASSLKELVHRAQQGRLPE